MSSLGIFTRLLLFRVTGRIMLLDPIRNHAYQWAWRVLRHLGNDAIILDIGSRNSPFPSFLSRTGFTVTVVEKDPRFAPTQQTLARQWGAHLDIRTADIRSPGEIPPVDVITALFSLQHAGNDDTSCHLAAAALLKPGGVLLTVNQCEVGPTRWETGRDDGDLRIFGCDDLRTRIIEPLCNAGCTLITEDYARAQFLGQRIRRSSTMDTGRNVSLLAFAKE